MNPVSINHIGITVLDIEQAITWYQANLGCELLKKMDFMQDDAQSKVLGKDIYGEAWGGMRIAHMTTPNQIGIELFEFIQPKSELRVDSYEYWKTGTFHLAFTDSDVRGRAKQIAENGGKQLSQVWEVVPGCEVVFCEDPFGNIIEICSHSYERFWSNR
jgi:catechol 2,3-dioxygenase-like lactoylglutathione lyase family enzyme